MKIETKYASPLVLEEIMITDSSFKRIEGKLDNIELNLSVGREIERLSENQYKISIDTHVGDKEQRMSVSVRCVAKFKTEQKNQGLIERNTIAIMFPYVRSYISTITTQPGMNPIVLPAMNIVAMLQDR